MPDVYVEAGAKGPRVACSIGLGKRRKRSWQPVWYKRGRCTPIYVDSPSRVTTGVLVTPCLIDGLLEGKESFILPVDRGRGCRAVVHKTEEMRGGRTHLGHILTAPCSCQQPLRVRGMLPLASRQGEQTWEGSPGDKGRGETKTSNSLAKARSCTPISLARGDGPRNGIKCPIDEQVGAKVVRG